MQILDFRQYCLNMGILQLHKPFIATSSNRAIKLLKIRLYPVKKDFTKPFSIVFPYVTIQVSKLLI